mmetsp:Transcript_8480/g.25667  ORF Transcript_8480/g.25667 Transcript_8480/m.25667 type:complete len:957 (-) Transcript_8480:212-3082(-)
MVLGEMMCFFGEFVEQIYGGFAWKAIKDKAGMDRDVAFALGCTSNDSLIAQLADATCAYTHTSHDELMRKFGQHFVRVAECEGYGELLMSLGRNLTEFLVSLSSLHLNMAMAAQSGIMLDFYVRNVTPMSLELHYFSKRPGFKNMLFGIIEKVATEYFKVDVSFRLLHGCEDGSGTPEVWQAIFPQQDAIDQGVVSVPEWSKAYVPEPQLLQKLFPFHALLDRDLRIVQCGASLQRVLTSHATAEMPFNLVDHVSCHLSLTPPTTPWDWQHLKDADGDAVVLVTKEGLDLKGAFHCTTLPNGDAGLLFVCSPVVSSLAEFRKYSLYMSDIASHDLCGDLTAMAERFHIEAENIAAVEKQQADADAHSQRLQHNLKMVLSERAGRACFDTSTPAAMAIKLCDMLLSNQQVDMSCVLRLRDAVTHSADMHRPTDLAGQLRGAVGDDNKDVAASLMNMLNSGGAKFQGMETDDTDAESDEHYVYSGMRSRRVSACSSSVVQNSVAAGSDNSALKSAAAVHTPTYSERRPTDGAAGVADVLAGAGKPSAPRDAARRSSLVELAMTSHTSSISDEQSPTGGLGGVLNGMEQRLAVRQRASKMSSGAPRGSHPATKSLSEKVLVLMRPPSDPVLRVLEKIDNWQFDSFELDAVTNGQPLSTLAFTIMKRLRLVPGRYRISEVRLARFLCAIEEGYLDNPYHSRVHAADVLRSVYVILTRGQVARRCWTKGHEDQGLLSAILAAVVHDFAHRGVNNDFLVKTADSLAMLYNDQSPMEHHHLSASFRIMASDDSFAFLQHVPSKMMMTLRKQVIDAVLGTDMKQHFNMLSMFNTKMGEFMCSGAGQPPVNWSALDLDDEQRSLVLQVTLKVADLGHLTSSRAVHREWVRRLQEEMFRQGDAERAANLPVSPLMDRSKDGITKSQPGFFKVVVMPLFTAFKNVFPQCTPLHEAAQANMQMWQAES